MIVLLKANKFVFIFVVQQVKGKAVLTGLEQSPLIGTMPAGASARFSLSDSDYVGTHS